MDVPKSRMLSRLEFERKTLLACKIVLMCVPALWHVALFGNKVM